MSPAEMTTKYVRPDRGGYGFLFLIKLLELNIILIQWTTLGTQSNVIC